MKLKKIFSRVVPILVLLLYFCLRTQEQCLEDPTVPHSDFITIKQKTTKSAPQCTTTPDKKQNTLVITAPSEIVCFAPSPEIIPNYKHVAVKKTCLHGCFRDRSPPVLPT